MVKMEWGGMSRQQWPRTGQGVGWLHCAPTATDGADLRANVCCNRRTWRATWGSTRRTGLVTSTVTKSAPKLG